MTKTNEAPTVLKLKDYKAPAFQVESVHLGFEILSEKVLVTNTMVLKTHLSDDLVLDGTDHSSVHIEINSQVLNANQYQWNDHSLTLPQTLLASLLKKSDPTFQLKIRTELNPWKNTSLEGLYASGKNLCTQCEAQGFRKISYFLDRPDVMTTYTTEIIADAKKYPVLLSNGDLLKEEVDSSGRRHVLWKDPFKKPCYLFALVAGDLDVLEDHFITRSGKKVLLQIYTEKGKTEACHHAMVSLKKAMQWDEERFGLEYDLNRYMIVATDDFNAGAMENKGLNIFNSRLVYANPETTTDDEYNAIESVVAHEYFHNWTGNRVTLRDWFQLSLKEGLTVFRDQEFSSDVGDRSLQRLTDVDSLRERQFPEDAGPNAHPVRPETCMSVDNFFTATIYEKGAELIRMMSILTGRSGFRKGMDLYFQRHDGQAVTTEDFAAAIADANGLDFSQFKSWYSQAGTPVVKVQGHYDALQKEYSLTLQQVHKNPNYIIPAALGLLSSEGRELPLKGNDVRKDSEGNSYLLLEKEKQSFVFKDIPSKPVPSLFRQFSAPVIVDSDLSFEEKLHLIQFDTDGFQKREVSQNVALHLLENLMAGESAKNQSELTQYLSVLKKVALDNTLSPAYRSFVVTPPSVSILAQQLKTLEARKMADVLRDYKLQLATSWKEELLKIYHQHHELSHSQDLSKSSVDSRQFKNTALSLLSGLKTKEIQNLVEEQYFTARNMTDRAKALLLSQMQETPRAEEISEHFLERYKNNSLVLNKWLSIHGAIPLPKSLQRVQQLTRHTVYNQLNPNNVLSLLGNFGKNLSVFYDDQLNCVDFYLSEVESIDSKNAQLAARLCGAFNWVHKLPPPQKESVKKMISRVLANTNLSKNTRELLQTV